MEDSLLFFSFLFFLAFWPLLHFGKLSWLLVGVCWRGRRPSTEVPLAFSGLAVLSSNLLTTDEHPKCHFCNCILWRLLSVKNELRSVVKFYWPPVRTVGVRFARMECMCVVTLSLARRKRPPTRWASNPDPLDLKIVTQPLQKSKKGSHLEYSCPFYTWDI